MFICGCVGDIPASSIRDLNWSPKWRSQKNPWQFLRITSLNYLLLLSVDHGRCFVFSCLTLEFMFEVLRGQKQMDGLLLKRPAFCSSGNCYVHVSCKFSCTSLLVACYSLVVVVVVVVADISRITLGPFLIVFRVHLVYFDFHTLRKQNNWFLDFFLHNFGTSESCLHSSYLKFIEIPLHV